MKKYKIAFALPNLENPGGPVVNVKKLTDYLREQGHIVHLFTFGKTNYNDNEFLHIINETKFNKQLHIFKQKYYKELKKGEFDIFIANNLRTHRISLKLDIKNTLFLFRQPSIVVREKNFFRRILKRYRLQKRYNNKHIASVSKCAVDNIISLYNLKPKSMTVLYNPFNFSTQKANERILDFINFPYIITVSRLFSHKGVDNVIKAYSKLKIKQHLVIVGDGPEKLNLIKLVRELKIENRVHFLGWQNNPYPYIKNADLLVFASSFETFGNVLLEALELNTPVVSTNYHCGANEILIGELSSFLVKVGDITELAKKIEEALKYYPKIDLSLYKKFELSYVCNQIIELIDVIKE